MPNSILPLPTPVSAPAKQQYSPEAVEAILSHALELQSMETCSPEQLQAMATELNIAPETLQAAEQHWKSHQAEIAHTREKLEQQQRQRRQQWLQYGAGSLLMIVINLATAGAITWSIFPVMGWGLSVVLGGCDRTSADNNSAEEKAVRTESSQASGSLS
ncbi:MAG: 2TM domain-containing protein [Cyanobacteria bacterium J06636_16]